ncbi:VanZ family protein [Aquisphaera insulae]|uniref:VanZ family protein n=1 Tax=Aquisphaera insulae TaxID=2712864 RepID=UPI0013EE18AF|nr:VanZ family protein [Aquisphaera insulae]
MTPIRLAFAVFCVFLVSIIVAADMGLGPRIWGGLSRVPMGDKMCHAALMFTLCLLANLVVSCRKLRPGRGGLLLATTVIGILVLAEEVSQIWIPGRNFDLLDLTADAVGLVAADLAARRLHGRAARAEMAARPGLAGGMMLGSRAGVEIRPAGSTGATSGD